METETHGSASCSVGILIHETSGTPLLSTASDRMSVLSGKSSLQIPPCLFQKFVTFFPALARLPCTYASIFNLNISKTPVL